MATRKQRTVKKQVTAALEGSPRLQGPLTKKQATPRITVMTPAAATRAAASYDEHVSGGLAAEKNSGNVNAEKAAALKSGNPWKKDTTSMKMDRAGRALNAKIGKAQPHGEKRLTQTGTKIQNVARVSSNVPKPKTSDFSRAEQVALTKNSDAPLGKNHPMFTDPNWAWDSDVAAGAGAAKKAMAQKPKRPSQKETTASPARRPAPSGKVIANNMSGKPDAERIVDAPKKGPAGVPWIGVE